MFTPSANTPIAVPRAAGSKRSAMIECEGGDEPASPLPTPMRASASWRKVCADPQSTVITLQTVVAATMMFRRLRRSASIAIGIPSVA
jgi:hypothetical protein